MVLSILIAAIVAPGLLGSQEAIRQSQSKEKREEHRARRCNLIATCVKSSARSREINGRQVVLRNGKLWIDTGTPDGSPLGHPYAGYYLPYPDTNYEGLVTTITDIAPIMNWVYIDKNTCEAKYGVRADAQPNLTGPFDCTRQDRRLTFDGWEGWCAVEEAPGLWGLYFDIFDNGLRSVVQPGTRVLEVELGRKEKRFQKEADARLGDQTTKREVDVKDEAPVERPLGAEALVGKPGVVVGDERGEVTEDKTREVGDDRGTLRPLRIPKSIFEDPPPVVGGMVFTSRTPKTPPPAYEHVGRNESVQAEVTKTDESLQPVTGEQSSEVPAGISNEGQNTASTLADNEQMPRVAENPGSVQSQSVPIYEIPVSPDKPDTPPAEPDGRPNYEMPASPDKPDSPSEEPQLKTVQKSVFPPAEGKPTPAATGTSLSPGKPSSPGNPASPPPAQQTTPKSEKRTTPKLNRNSGTRALAQAQMFEAMAAGQVPREEVQKRLSQRGSRASSNTSSLYSIEDEVVFNASILSKKLEIDPTPPPLEVMPKEKVLAPRRDMSASPENTPDPSVQQPVTPPRQRAPSIREDPAISLDRSASSTRVVSSLPRRPNEGRAPPPFPVTPVQRSVSQRSTTSLANRQRDRNLARQSPSPSASRPDLSRSSPRSSAQSTTQRLSSTTRQRDRSASERSSTSRLDASSASPRASPQVSTPTRPSLARTMTSGKGNQGMSNRIGGSIGARTESPVQNRVRAGTVGRKTTSALFRELDDLVGQEDAGSDSGRKR